ncbi:MAG: ABC transporter ATP-binding protein [Planctomycetota bacterium]
MTSPAIAINDLTVTYPGGLFRAPRRGVNGLSFTVDRGELFGFLGPNGAGKTTTIKVLTGLLAPDGGGIRIMDADIRDRATRRRIGFMPENPYFYEHLTARESLHMYGGLFDLPRAAVRSRADVLLERVGLRGVDRVRVGAYSKGMRQRLGFAQALINEPDVVILDEPLSGLDPIGRAEMMNIIRDLHRSGTTVFFSSHILPDVEHTCTRVALINQGRLITIGPLDEIIRAGGHSVEIVIRGAADAVAAAAPGYPAEARPSDLIAVIVPDQPAANAVIRAAAGRGLEIVSVEPGRQTLESVFIELVQKASGG